MIGAVATEITYEFKNGARVPMHVTPEAVYAALCDVKKRCGRLTASTLVDDVESDPEHPLRWAFTWQGDAAVRKLHEIEAGDLIRVVVVKHIVPDQETAVRAFVVTRENGERHYEETRIVIRQPDLRAQLMDQVEAEFERAERKRRELLALVRMI